MDGKMGSEQRRDIVEAFRRLSFDPELTVLNAAMADADEPVMIVRYRDTRYPGWEFGAWWDFHDADRSYFVPSLDVDGLAVLAKIWLEELAHAGRPVDERPIDSDGVAWGEMNGLGEDRLPPHLRN